MRWWQLYHDCSHEKVLIIKELTAFLSLAKHLANNSICFGLTRVATLHLRKKNNFLASVLVRWDCCHKVSLTGCHRAMTLYGLTVWEVEVQDHGVSTFGSFKGCDDESVPCLLVFLGLHMHYPDLCLHVHTTFSLCACLCTNLPFLWWHRSCWIRDPPYSGVTSS